MQVRTRLGGSHPLQLQAGMQQWTPLRCRPRLDFVVEDGWGFPSIGSIVVILQLSAWS